MASTVQSVKQAKGELRKQISRRLVALTDKERDTQSSIVANKLFQTPQYVASKRVSVYLSMKNEIQTQSIVRNLLNTKQCFIPHYTADTMKMVPLFSLDDYTKLPETKWKIKQPADDDVRPDALETGGLDLILMPGVAFTESGCRLGHGRGYYDKYLQKCAESGKKPFTIGLSFNEQMCDDIPTTDTDIPIDLILFPG